MIYAACSRFKCLATANLQSPILADKASGDIRIIVILSLFKLFKNLMKLDSYLCYIEVDFNLRMVDLKAL